MILLQTDAETFASWGVDYVKLDGCYSEPKDMDTGYPEFGMYPASCSCISMCIKIHLYIAGMYLNKTNRPMVYSCSWPAYQIGKECKDTVNKTGCEKLPAKVVQARTPTTSR